MVLSLQVIIATYYLYHAANLIKKQANVGGIKEQ